MKTENSFYQEDLAFVHDSDFGQVAEYAARHLQKLLAKRQIHSGLVVDLGCGSGILASQMTEAGYQVLGIDYSASMIELARAKAPKASFQVGSFLDMEFPKCEVVTATGEIFNYLVDEKNTLDALERLFQQIFCQLSDRGIFMFDLFCSGVPLLEGVRIIESEEWDMLIQYIEEPDQKKLSRDILLYRKTGENTYRKSREVHTIQLFEVDSILRMLTEAGFAVSSMDHYDSHQFRNRHIGFVGTK